MTIPGLLIPRYLVVADWFGNDRLPVGAILFKHGSIPDWFYLPTRDPACLMNGLKESAIQKHPHLVRPLQWWEHRKPEDMPEYVKWTRTQKEGVIQRAEYNIASNTIFLDNHPMTFTMWIAALEPATLEEYNAYLTQKRKEMTPEQKAEELYTPHDNMFMAKRKAFVEGANWQSPTPEAVAVAFGEWKDKYTVRDTEYKDLSRLTDFDGGWYTNKELFTLFTQSDEYKELTK